MARPKIRPFRDGKVHVLSEKCKTCVFRPGNLMHLNPGHVKKMVEFHVGKQSGIRCHETVHSGRKQAICRGFFDLYKTQPLQLAERLGCIEFQEPPE